MPDTSEILARAIRPSNDIQGAVLIATGSEPPETDSEKLLFETLETAHSQRIESTYLVDLRRHARFDTQYPGIATAERGESVDVAVTNVSRSGLRLEGSQLNECRVVWNVSCSLSSEAWIRAPPDARDLRFVSL